VLTVIGDIKGKNALIIDDLLDTGGTIVNAALALKERGAKDVYVGCTHGLFSGDAPAKIRDSGIKEIVVTDTVRLNDHKAMPNLTILSVADLLGEAIRRIHLGESVSSLFI
jgi:ribose-phosphate pyrophosphokinase